MLGARRVLLLGPFAVLSFVGLACAPTTRDFGNTGGQGGGTTGEGSAVIASSSSGQCSTGNVESCFNGLDDDCNGKTDCEDPACDAVAVCEPVALGAPNGTVVDEAEACPDGFTADEQLIHRKLEDTGCTGCACKLFTPVCTGDVWYFESTSTCAAATSTSGGIYGGTFGSACSSQPINKGSNNTFVLGVRTGPWNIQEGCSPGGTGTPAAPTWGETKKFCRANAEGKGCSAGNTCVPKPAAAPHCALAAGTSSCTGFATAESDWYTGFSDARACGACECKASGGSCDPVQLAVGNDYTCTTSPVVDQSSKLCIGGNGAYSPPVQLVNKPKPSTCTTSAKTTGALTPTGQLTLCCQP